LDNAYEAQVCYAYTFLVWFFHGSLFINMKS
jgi:hypothetical protein